MNSIQRHSPLFCHPHLVERPWGGKALAAWGKDVGDRRIGESWEIVDLPEHSTRFANGPWPTLGDLIAGNHLGPAHEFPLLVKLLDAQENLSIQLHPSRTDHFGRAKSEAWYILSAPKDAFLYAGVSQEMPASEWVDKVAAGDLSVLQKVPVQKGDVVFIPGGTPHALTAGLLVAEVQQSSDSTWRIWDWNRRDAAGHPRQLHLEDARRDISPVPRHDLKIPTFRLNANLDLLCANPHFAMTLHHGNHLVQAGEGLRILLQLEDGGYYANDSGKHALPRGTTCLLLPHTEMDLLGGSVLEAWVPDLERDVRLPLGALGHSEQEIRRLGAGTW